MSQSELALYQKHKKEFLTQVNAVTTNGSYCIFCVFSEESLIKENCREAVLYCLFLSLSEEIRSLKEIICLIPGPVGGE